jgi:hypothetical protein
VSPFVTVEPCGRPNQTWLLTHLLGGQGFMIDSGYGYCLVDRYSIAIMQRCDWNDPHQRWFYDGWNMQIQGMASAQFLDRVPNPPYNDTAVLHKGWPPDGYFWSMDNVA